MSVQADTEIEIRRPRSAVAAYASEPENAPEWYENIESAEWVTERPLVVGSRFRFAARFMGRRLVYTYEGTELVPDERLVMSTDEGPFPMETPTPGQPWMTLRNRGQPASSSCRAVHASISRKSRAWRDTPF
jgi:hypothetical protein